MTNVNRIGLLVLGLLLSAFRADARVLNLFLDGSGSGDPKATRVCLDKLERGLPAIVEELGLTEVRFLVWARGIDSWRGAERVFALPPRSCADPEAGETEKGPFTARVAEATGLFKNAALRAERQRERQRAENRKEREAKLAAALAPVGEVLRNFDREAEAPVTCLEDALLRGLSEPAGTVTIVVSDGVSYGCGSEKEHAAALPDRLRTGTVILVLLPARGDDAAIVTHIVGRSRRLSDVFPELRIAPAVHVTADGGWLRAFAGAPGPACDSLGCVRAGRSRAP
ncbi:MAG: hypothetical protein ACREQ9_04170 [Candidatus Binatia bacterium]